MLNIDAVDGNIFNCIKMVFTGLARQSSIGKFAYNGVDDSLNLLSRFVIVLLLGLMFMSLLVIPLSPSIFCYVFYRHHILYDGPLGGLWVLLLLGF